MTLDFLTWPDAFVKRKSGLMFGKALDFNKILTVSSRAKSKDD